MQSSPFEQVHRQLGARFENYHGWSLPADFGDPTGESKALTDHCAAIDLSAFGRIQLSGNSIKETLNAIIDTDNTTLGPDQWVWGKLTSQTPNLTCRIARSNGQYFVLTQPGQVDAISSSIEFASNGTVKTADVSNQTAMLGLYGPAAYTSLRGVLPFDIDYLEKGDVEKMSFMMMSFTLLRGSWLDGEGLELICPAAAGTFVAGAVAKYKDKHNITPAGMDCLQEAMDNTETPI